MKKLFLLCSVTLFVYGCASMMTDSMYSFDVTPQQDKTSQVEVKITELQQKFLLFSVTNQAANGTLKINWDESVIIDTKGQPRRMLIQGKKYTDAGASTPPSMIPAGATINQAVTYADGVQFVGNFWIESEIVPCSAMGQICSREGMYGKKLTLLLNLERDGKKFEISTALLIKKKPDSPQTATETETEKKYPY